MCSLQKEQRGASSAGRLSPAFRSCTQFAFVLTISPSFPATLFTSSSLFLIRRIDSASDPRKSGSLRPGRLHPRKGFG